MEPTRLRSLAEAKQALARIDWRTVSVSGPWTVGEVLAHCAQSLEYGLSGFPRPKPWLFRATVGRIALGVFLRRGQMRHDLSAAIPGAPAPAAHDALAGRDRLLLAIDAFCKSDQFAPHFAYGAVDKARYDQVQAMHIADHFASMSDQGSVSS